MTSALYSAAVHAHPSGVCQHIRSIPARPWLLTPSHPAPLAGGPCSAPMTLVGEQVRGYFVPEPGLALDVGWSTLPGCGGVNARHAETCWPSLQCLLAPAWQPLSLGQRHGFMTFLCIPVSLCASGVPGVRLLGEPRPFPPHGLRTSRYRGECVSAPHQGQSESHRHRVQVLMSSRVAAVNMGPIPPIVWPIRFLANESHFGQVVIGRDLPIVGPVIETISISAEDLLDATDSQVLRQLLHARNGLRFEHRRLPGRTVGPASVGRAAPSRGQVTGPRRS
jgi:hypothetical protein